MLDRFDFGRFGCMMVHRRAAGQLAGLQLVAGAAQMTELTDQVEPLLERITFVHVQLARLKGGLEKRAHLIHLIRTQTELRS